MNIRKSLLSLRLGFLLLVLSALAIGETRVRIVNGNISSGNAQSYDEGSGIRLFQGLQPDIALIQEFNYGGNSDRSIRKFVDETFGNAFGYYREPIEGIPNGIVSRFPIEKSGTLRDSNIHNRGFAWAKIQVPGKRPLWAFSVHLSHGNRDERTAAARQIIDFIRRESPENDLVILGGDLNLTSRNEPALAVLKQELSDGHVPVGPEGKAGTNAKREKPYDLLLPSPELDALHIPVSTFRHLSGGTGPEFPHGLVFDSRTFQPLSAVAPIRKSDSSAPNMQHMAIVKDFELK